MKRESVSLRPLADGDAPALLTFYNSLSAATIRLFRPLGLQTSLEVCRKIASENRVLPAGRFDLIACASEKIIGWTFVSGLNTPRPEIGLGVADDFQGQGIGTALLAQLTEWAQQRGLPTLHLIVVQDNQRALHLYQRFGFVIEGEWFNDHDQLPYFRMTAQTPPAEE